MLSAGVWKDRALVHFHVQLHVWAVDVRAEQNLGQHHAGRSKNTGPTITLEALDPGSCFLPVAVIKTLTKKPLR